ncbi:HNH endonuclease [Klebsiella sp. B345]|uniref:HNH endonuclease n=1 Tax=Klebsiella sp. B345 TaxID=2755398 RepID=UPI003DA8CA46
MGSLIIIACVIFFLYTGVKFLAGIIYKADPTALKSDRDAWGRKPGEGPRYIYPTRSTADEDDREAKGLFQAIIRRQQEKEREQAKRTSQTFYNSREWRALRYQALKKYGGACSACGRSAAKHGVVIHVDHIKPRSKYPHLALRLDNLQLLCHECNLAKGNRDEIKWR